MKRILQWTALVLIAMSCGQLFALSPAPLSEDEQVKTAELIFEGTVVAVEYRSSDADGPDEVSLPHTFVTFEIARAFKGRSELGSSITLRFLGGPDEDGLYLVVPGIPLFDVGERGIFFVEGNGVGSCPLVGCDQGRFRLVDGFVYTDDGFEVTGSIDGVLDVGRPHELTEVEEHQLEALPRSIQRAPEESTLSALPKGFRHLDEDSFIAMIQNRVQELHGGKRADLPATRSTVLFERFVTLQPTAVAPPEEGREEMLPQQGEEDPYEADQMHRSGGDPTLRAEGDGSFDR